VQTPQLPLALKMVVRLREKFQRDEEVDEQERDSLAAVITEHTSAYSAEESSTIANICKHFEQLSHSNFTSLESPDHFIAMSFCEETTNNKRPKSTSIFKGVATIDSSISSVAAWEIATMNRASINAHTEFGGLARSYAELNEHSAITNVEYGSHIIGLSPRRFLSWQLWKWVSESELVVVYAPKEDYPDFPLPKGTVSASNTALVKLERLQPIGDIPQTRATYFTAAVLGGICDHLLSDIARSMGVGNLLHLRTMRTAFDRTWEIDSASRTKTIAQVEDHGKENSTAASHLPDELRYDVGYTPEENLAIAQSRSLFSTFADDPRRRQAPSLSQLSFNEMARDPTSKTATGRSKASVGAPPSQVLAYLWDFLARHRTGPDSREKRVIEQFSDHNKIVHMVRTLPEPIGNREFVMRYLWKKVDKKQFVFVIDPVSHHTYPEDDPTRIRAFYKSAAKITLRSNGRTSLDYIICIDFGGNESLKTVSRFMPGYMKDQLALTVYAHNYFQEHRQLAEYGFEDGRAIGEQMMVELHGEKRRAHHDSVGDVRIRSMFKMHQGLREMAKEREFFPAMLSAVVDNSLFKAVSSVESKLCSLSVRDGQEIGGALAGSLAMALTTDAAVDGWIVSYPALQELDEEMVWFRPMMELVAERLLSEVAWGVKFRVFFGAALSSSDLFSGKCPARTVCESRRHERAAQSATARQRVAGNEPPFARLSHKKTGERRAIREEVLRSDRLRTRCPERPMKNDRLRTRYSRASFAE